MSVLINGSELRTIKLGRKVSRAAATLPATTSTAYFTVTGGRVLITSLIGEVTTVCSGTATNLNLTLDPDGANAVADLAAATAITSDAVGTIYTVTGAPADLLSAPVVGSTAIPNYVSGVLAGHGFIVPAGSILLKTSATNTGATKWDLTYIPFDDGAAVVTA